MTKFIILKRIYSKQLVKYHHSYCLLFPFRTFILVVIIKNIFECFIVISS